MKRTLLFLMAMPTLANACYNDRDTLGFELNNRPDVQRALTGRFERNPPLYYEMRVARLRRKANLTSAERDDLAVALDRLGRSDEALAALAAGRRSTLDENYRFYANRGTVRAHRWIHRGAKKAELRDLREAERDIAEALRLNPKAHFGREGTQLEVIRWMADLQTKAAAPEYLGERLMSSLDEADPVEGLAGLITLGAAWESPDAALAIAEISYIESKHALAELALMRYRELRQEGRRSFAPSLAAGTEASMKDFSPLNPGTPPVKDRYVALREEADAWQAARTAYMEKNLRIGLHPDTHADFWNGWKEPAAPKIPLQLPQAPSMAVLNALPTILPIGAVAGAGFLGLIVWRIRRKELLS